MKKVFLLFVVVVVAAALYVYYPDLLGGGSIQEQDTAHFVADKPLQDTAADKLNTILDDLEEKISPAEKALKELQTTLKDEVLEIDLLTNTDAGSDIHVVYAELIGGYHERIAAEKTLDDILPAQTGIPRSIQVTVQDGDNGSTIPGANVYMRGALVGETTANGVLVVERMIPRSHDIMVFEIYKPGYSRAFERVNVLYHDAPEVLVDVTLQSSTAHRVITHTDDLAIEENDFVLDIDAACALRTAEGDCYEGEVVVEYTYLGADDVDAASIPMQAISNGEIKYLVSNGMALTDFYGADNTRLIYDATGSKLCYRIGAEQVAAWEDRLKWGDSREGYRWFDRAIGYWKYDEDAVVTIEDGEFCVETAHVY